jgi:hypothetical protein
MTEQHESLEVAKARLDVLAKEAGKQGRKRGQFQAVSKPDAFRTIRLRPRDGTSMRRIYEDEFEFIALQ